MPKKLKKDGLAKVHDNLKGFDIKINEFGAMDTNLSIDRLNSFLDENVADKKLPLLSEEE
jgi:hypothetical protein